MSHCIVVAKYPISCTIMEMSICSLQEHRYYEPRLVAVSKLHSTDLILAAYEAGQRHFGENYVNELVDKAYSSPLHERCREIHWHFIGNLQRNKVNKVLNVPHLYIIETVSSDKLASTLNNSWPKFRKNDDSKLNIMVQVNTSQEKGNNICQIYSLARISRCQS